MRKEPTQEFLKEVYEAGGFFKDSTRIYQAEYSQAQRQYWYFPVKYEKATKIIGYKIVKRLGGKMLNEQIQYFIGEMAEKDTERAFNEAWDELSNAIYELTNRPDDIPEESEEIIQKFIRLPVVVNILKDLATGHCCPPNSTDEAREKAWKFYDIVPPKTCGEIVYDWKVYLNNINGENK